MNNVQYTLVKLPIREIIAQNFNVTFSRNQEIEHEYLIAQPDSLIFDQIQRIRGYFSSFIPEVILVVARKNPKQEQQLCKLLREGFQYNGVRFLRFGKSASQGKAGITAFVCDSIFKELYTVTQMDIPVDHCVISKYEAQRCLVFSSCTLVDGYMPSIAIIGEYQKNIPHQLIKYVTERQKERIDPATGERHSYKSREIEEGYRDITISPFDGCGCHEAEFMNRTQAALDLDYQPIGVQVRLPFVKGYSVYVPFREMFKAWGLSSITDIYGHVHDIDQVDCIWNISMFKGHRLFQSHYGENAWVRYLETFNKYHFKLGISKYSHHLSRLNKMTRMNFQYLQCLDLWNQNYIDQYERRSGDYNILAPENEGKIISIARYTTELYEKIIKGDVLYTYKFMGISDESSCEPESKYLEAAMTNRLMLKDPAVRQFIYRKLKKAINEAKVGKIYAEGFYHTIVGDMVGYLQYAAGQTPIGCLKAHEFYCQTLNPGDCLSFRSPLVCPSEVNKIRIVTNGITERWFSHFKGQDVVMLNMYDISAPQQGGADYDGDIVFLCNNQIIIDSKIEKPVIIDIDDKATAIAKPYTVENLVDYEVLTRDNRIGEITNAATSVENKYTTDEKIQKLHSDYASLLRVFQGKEIDFQKTGFRWQMNKGLRAYLKQLPYFLLYNYPQKMNAYKRLKETNKHLKTKEEKLKLNVYHSPSPMNELCDFICTWEKRKILWDTDVLDTRRFTINHELDLSDPGVIRLVRHHINRYADDLKKHFSLRADQNHSDTSAFNIGLLLEQYKAQLREQLELDEEVIANYVISVSYRSRSTSKALAWGGYGDYILENLRRNSSPEQRLRVVEVSATAPSACNYLGKYYQLQEVKPDQSDQ